jgi:hypothetical protein
MGKDNLALLSHYDEVSSVLAEIMITEFNHVGKKIPALANERINTYKKHVKSGNHGANKSTSFDLAKIRQTTWGAFSSHSALGKPSIELYQHGLPFQRVGVQRHR